METVHTEVIDGVTYTLSIEQDDSEVRGNAFASGDDAEDKAVEDEILARLDNGDIWAWACVTVTASLEVAGVTFKGTDGLCGCNYANTAEFIAPGGYYDDMKAGARTELIKRLAEHAQRTPAVVAALETLKAVA